MKLQPDGTRIGIMRESSKTALGGVIAALSLTIMLLTYLSPVLTYTVPPAAGLLLVIILSEISPAWAIATYAATGLLSLFLLADKEAAMMYVAFFGYYPILRVFLDEKIKLKPLRFFIKLIIFNVSVAVTVLVCSYVFAVDYSEFGKFGNWFMIFFAVCFNIIFLFYEFLIEKLIYLYKNHFRSKLRKIFRFR